MLAHLGVLEPVQDGPCGGETAGLAAVSMDGLRHYCLHTTSCFLAITPVQSDAEPMLKCAFLASAVRCEAPARRCPQ